MREYEREVRWFWWPASRLTYRWRPFILGEDEWMRLTLGVRLPGGMLFLPLWRFPDSVGPCTRCGQWEAAEVWPEHGDRCAMCVNDRQEQGAGRGR